MTDRHTPAKRNADAADNPSKFRCPICGKPAEDEALVPFCSKRCRTIDLGNWADEKYTISRPVEQSDLDEGE